MCTYWETLRDGDLNIEEEDSGSESGAHSNRLLGITEHTADTARKQLSLIQPNIHNPTTQTSLVKICKAKQAFQLILTQKWQKRVYLILMMSMPVTVRLTWSPAAAQSKASSCSVIPVVQIDSKSPSIHHSLTH